MKGFGFDAEFRILSLIIESNKTNTVAIYLECTNAIREYLDCPPHADNRDRMVLLDLERSLILPSQSDQKLSQTRSEPFTLPDQSDKSD